jgi:hypothetical protein
MRNALVSNPINLAAQFGFDVVEAFDILPEDKKPNWRTSRAEIEKAAEEFLKYITLVIKNPNAKVVPSEKQDDVWHEFMLHPVAYYNFCMKNAGYLIDHNGGFGLRAGEMPILIRLYGETQKLWELTYGEPHPVTGLSSTAATCYNTISGEAATCYNAISSEAATCYSSCGNSLTVGATTC